MKKIFCAAIPLGVTLLAILFASCSKADPVVDASQLGAACSSAAPCPSEKVCASYEAIDPTLKGARCAPYNPCTAVDCDGDRCGVGESEPLQVTCE
jgi:hypothetical protein